MFLETGSIRNIRKFTALFVALFGLWLLMSGLFKPLLVAFGIVSSALTVWIVSRLRLTEIDGPSPTQWKIFGSLRYLFWLIVEIGKADWAVTKTILGASDQLQQQLIRVPAEQKSDFGKALFANSITITPGTVCVDTLSDTFIVHALNNEAANLEALKAMEQHVCSLEGDVG